MIYKGLLDLKPGRMSKEALQGYCSYLKQRNRCNNPRNVRYKSYGGKGIQVKYTSREFVGWWIKNLKKFNGVRPTCGRIDHDGHYEFSNIKMECVCDNAKERMRRLGPHRAKKWEHYESKLLVALNKNTFEVVHVNNLKGMAQYLKMHRDSIPRILKTKFINGLEFRHLVVIEVKRY